jgi:hypothetical protein
MYAVLLYTSERQIFQLPFCEKSNFVKITSTSIKKP